MAWAKIDDKFFSHPKVRSAGRDATLLHLAALTYCNEHLTDGFIQEESIPYIAMLAFIDVEDAKQNLSKLLSVGLWEECEGGYLVHDYLEYNPTREMVEETRAARAEAGKRGGEAKTPEKQASSRENGRGTQAKAKQKLSKTQAISPPLPIYPDNTKNVLSGAPETPSLEAAARSKPPPDPQLRHPAILCFKGITSRYPPKQCYQQVIDTLGEHPDGPRAADCYAAWTARGYKPTNLDGWLGWYRDGIPPSGPPGKNGSKQVLNEPAGFEAIRQFRKERGLDNGNG